MLDSNKIRAKIAQLYDKDPQGWRVLTGKDRLGFYDILISHGTEAWQLKEYQVNPYKFVGLGSRIPDLAESPQSQEFHFGLRPIGIDQIKELANIDDPASMSDIASRLLLQKPVALSEAMNGPAVLHGPILQSSGRPIEALSREHSDLDNRLRKQLQDIVNKKFRHTVTPYI